jgi:hypothetical protein
MNKFGKFGKQLNTTLIILKYVINSLSSFYYKFFEKMQFLPLLIINLNNLLNLNFPLFQML